MEKDLESLAAYSAIKNLDDLFKTAYLQNEIEEAELSIQEPLQIVLVRYEMSKYNSWWSIYWDRKEYIQKHRVKAFSILRGQCQKVFIDKMKSDTDWEISEQSVEPLLII